MVGTLARSAHCRNHLLAQHGIAELLVGGTGRGVCKPAFRGHYARCVANAQACAGWLGIPWRITRRRAVLGEVSVRSVCARASDRAASAARAAQDVVALEPGWTQRVRAWHRLLCAGRRLASALAACALRARQFPQQTARRALGLAHRAVLGGDHHLCAHRQHTHCGLQGDRSASGMAWSWLPNLDVAHDAWACARAVALRATTCTELGHALAGHGDLAQHLARAFLPLPLHHLVAAHGAPGCCFRCKAGFGAAAPVGYACPALC